MELNKKSAIAIGIAVTLIVVMNIIALVIAFKPNEAIEYNKRGFQMIQSRLDKLDSTYIAEQVRIDIKLDSLDMDQSSLFKDINKYNDNLTNSVNKIKRYKNEIIKHNYRDSSSTSIIDRLNSN